MKLSNRVYRLNLGVPKEFDDMSAYSAYLGNGVVDLEKRIAELETATCRFCGTPCHGPLSEGDFWRHKGLVDIIDDLKAELNQCLDCCKRVGELEAENERLLDMMREARRSITTGPMDDRPGYNKPWSKCIAILDEALAEGK